MNKEFLIRDDHIGIFKNFLPNELIDSYLNYFRNCEKQGAVYPRKEDESLVSDNAIDTIRDGINVALTYTNKPFIDIFFKEIYPLYVKKYSHLKKLATHNILEVRFRDVYPTGLTGLQYNQQAADVDYLTATVSFEYEIYDFATTGSSTTSVTTS